MTLRQIFYYAKWLWVVGIVVFAGVYGYHKSDTLIDGLTKLPLWVLIGSAGMIFASKLCLVGNMKLSAEQFGVHIPWQESFRIYNFTQLAKYIPGSIWQFVGRISILREKGIPISAIRDTLLAEQLWMIGSAVVLGLVGTVFFGRDLLMQLWAFLGLADNNNLLIWSLSAVTVIIAGLGFRHFHRWMKRMRPPLRVVVVMVICWVSMGLSLWLTLIPYVPGYPEVLFVVGVYCLAYVAGAVAPFAPAGLGVREAVLIMALQPLCGLDIAVFLSALNRVVYFFVELLLAAVGLVGAGGFKRS